MSTASRWRRLGTRSTPQPAEMAAVVEELIIGHLYLSECPGRFLGIIGQNPGVSQVQPVTSADLSVFLHYSEVYSIDSSNIISNFPEAFNFNSYFSLSFNWFML